MDCVLMVGGRATRMGGAPKPLLEVCGVPMAVRVLRSLSGICEKIYVVYSKWTRELEDLCRGALGGVICVEGGGESYVDDLRLALSLASLPALVVPADIPFLSPAVLEDFVARAMARAEPVVNLATERGLTGVSLFKRTDGPWTDIVVSGDDSLVDVDTWEDYARVVERC